MDYDDPRDCFSPSCTMYTQSVVVKCYNSARASEKIASACMCIIYARETSVRRAGRASSATRDQLPALLPPRRTLFLSLTRALLCVYINVYLLYMCA